jgi:uncharacterized protein YndB with AHSA1/START domain
MSTIKETVVEADPALPVIRMCRDFAATPAQLFRAHVDPDLFAQWIGPAATTIRIDRWDATTGGSYRYASMHNSQEYGFHGCFHDVRPNRIVQTFTFDGEPDTVALNTLWIEGLGQGRTRLRSQSLLDSFATRDGWLRGGMRTGLDDGYTKLERMVHDGTL